MHEYLNAHAQNFLLYLPFARFYVGYYRLENLQGIN